MSKFIDSLVCERNGTRRYDGFALSRNWERRSKDTGESVEHLDEYQCSIKLNTIIALKPSEREEGLRLVRDNLIRYVYSDFLDKLYLLEKALFERDVNKMEDIIKELKKEAGINLNED